MNASRIRPSLSVPMIALLSLFLSGVSARAGAPSAITFGPSGLVFHAPAGSNEPRIALEFIGGSPSARIERGKPAEPAAAYVLADGSIGRGKRGPFFRSAAYRDIYPGVDVVLTAEERGLKYDFYVQPGADPAKIQLAYEGIDRLDVSRNGDLVVNAGFGELVDERPEIFQEIDGKRVAVSGAFRILSEGRYGFEIGPYDRSRPLVVDPLITFSTYLGGTADDPAYGVAVDSAGSAYVVGSTDSVDFPTKNPYQSTISGPHHAFVSKFSNVGLLAYSTLLGGGGNDDAFAVAVDSSGNAYLTGRTGSTDFPTKNAYQATKPPGSTYVAFVTKIAAAGSALAYSTYLGGSGIAEQKGQGIAVDSAGDAYVVGLTLSTDFPVKNAYQPAYGGAGDAFVTEISQAGSTLGFSTYLGGSSADWGKGISLICGAVCRAFVTGKTSSADFPTSGPYQATNAGGEDVFVTKLAVTGTSIEYSTYLGGSNDDDGASIATLLTDDAYAYVAGTTLSSNFPTKNAYQSTHPASGIGTAFVTKLSTTTPFLAYSTHLGGDAIEWVYGVGIRVDSSGGAWVTGDTFSTNFPTKSAYQPSKGGGKDAFVTKLLPSGSALAFSTYLGGSGNDEGNALALDGTGAAYVVGIASSTDFPTRNAYQATLRGAQDAFLTRFPGRGMRLGSADYNGDHQDEIGVFRNGMWFLTDSNDYSGVDHVVAFGSPIPGKDVPDIGEFNCLAAGGGQQDGQTDLAIFRKATSTWQALLSPDWSGGPDLSVTFATTSHKRIATRRLDTNGDGCSDIGVFKNGCFDVLESPLYASITVHACFGPGTDEPLAADLDGDGKSDLILWRAASAHYSFRVSSDSYTTDHGADLGAGDYPLLADMNGDERSDLGSYKQSTSTFRFSFSPSFSIVNVTKTHGVSGDIPMVADMNGDGRGDIGIFRNAIARWWFLCSPSLASSCVTQSFGTSGDIPIYGKPPGMP